jgi:hypothetical protein
MGALRLVRAAQLAFREHPARRAAPVDYKAASCLCPYASSVPQACYPENAMMAYTR